MNPRYVLLIGAASLLLGSLLPWASMGLFSVNGIEGDGKLTLGIGVLIGLGALISAGRLLGWASAVLGAAACVIALVDYNNLTSNTLGLVQIGAGLYLVGIGGIICIVGGLMPRPGAALTSSYRGD